MVSVPVRFSERVQRSGKPPIAYLMEQGIVNPDVLSLAAGFVDMPSLPVAQVRSACLELLNSPQRGRQALQYGTTDGDLALREQLVGHLANLEGRSASELGLSAERLVVGTGSQQLLYLLGEVLLDPGDIVLVGAPTYFVYTGALESLGARLVAVATDQEGIQPDALEACLTELERQGELARVKLIYDVTYFNNPTGLCLSASRRAALVELVRRWSKHQRIFLLEDAAYRELRYHGTDLPSLLSFDPAGEHVVYAGTFSKSFSPGLRVGYLVVPRMLREAIIYQKGHHDFGSPNLLQQLAAELLASGAYRRHLTVLRNTYSEKLAVTLDALQQELGPLTDQVNWTEPRGGLYVWMQLPPTIATGMESPFFRDCLQAKVLYVPGEFFYPRVHPDMPLSQLRLSFGVPSVPQLREALARLAAVIRRTLKRSPAGSHCPPPGDRTLATACPADTGKSLLAS